MPDRGYFFDALFNGKGGLRKAKSLRTNISEMADLLMLNVRLTYVKQATHLCSSKYMLSYFFCRGYVRIVSIMWHVQNAQVHAAYSIVRG